jgi:membrane fusion protein (multidrug efflux system)
MMVMALATALALHAGKALADPVNGIQRASLNPGGVAALDKREIRAQLMPRRYTTLAAEIGAKVNRLPIEEGGRFRAGDRLITFDCSLQQTQLDKAQAALQATEQTWKANQRLEELRSIGKVELEISQAETLKARADVASYKVVLSKCAVAAPFSGRVAEQKVREQQYVQPGQALLDILDDSTLELEFIVPSKWLVWLKPRHGFQVFIDETGKSYPARVQRIGARVDPVSQSVKLSAIVDGRFNELIAGMSGRVVMAPPATAANATSDPGRTP